MLDNKELYQRVNESVSNCHKALEIFAKELIEVLKKDSGTAKDFKNFLFVCDSNAGLEEDSNYLMVSAMSPIKMALIAGRILDHLPEDLSDVIIQAFIEKKKGGSDV